MKILFILTIDMNIQGPSVHLLNSVIDAALERGHSVHVIMPRVNNRDKAEWRKDNNLAYTYIITSKPNKNNLIQRYLNDLAYVKKCAEVYKKLKNIDAVFLQSNNVAYYHIKRLNRFVGKPIIFNVQDIFPQNLMYVGGLKKNSFVYLFLAQLQYKAYCTCTSIITISPDMKDTIVNLGIPLNKVNFIYNWSYSDEKIQISDSENKFSKLHSLKSTFNIVYAGNIGKMQNVEVIVKSAVNMLSENVNFYIIGNGNTEKFEEFVNENKLKNVTFLPMQPSNLAESVYAFASVIVIPLHKNIIKTALPSKTATCLRLDKPIIFCIDEDSKFAREMSKYENVYTCNGTDPTELAEIIKKIKNNGPSYYDAYSFVRDNMSCVDNPRKYIEIIEQTVRGKI